MSTPTAAAVSERPGATPAALLRAGVHPLVPAAAARLAREGAFFSLFSLPNPATPSVGVPLVPLVPALAIAFKVSEALHRFEVEELPPEAVCGLRIRQAAAKDFVARVSMQMTPAPNNFQGGPGRVPWATVLIPLLSQRFVPLDGHFNFFDDEQSGFSAEGAGRVFPTGGGLQPRLAAVLDAIDPTGKLAGLDATGIVNGDIAPPSGFAFNVLFRITDPHGTLRAAVPPAPLGAAADPTPQIGSTPGASFLPFLAEPDPERPLVIEQTGDGRLRMRITERLRQVSLAFGVHAPGLRSETRPGAVVGSHETTLEIDLSQASASVIPAFSHGDTFRFFDRGGAEIGGFHADTREARLFPATRQDGSAFLRIGGFAEPRDGWGQLSTAIGMVSINGAIDPAGGATSTLYMVRLSLPDSVVKVVAPASGGATR